jgi:ABC transporter with metal-binding/Fe-S-binding domain ATP-binding protein
VKIAALFSGGKDSTYALYVAQQRGWEVSNLITIVPSEYDSMLYHVPNIHLAPLLSECLGIHIVSREAGRGEDEEIRALREVLVGLQVDGLVMGTIASDYQKSRVDALCHDLGLRCFAPLWRQNQASLLADYLSAGFRILITGVAAEGLDESWLGREIDDKARLELLELNEKHGLSPCGEGGEYETLVIDGPNFLMRLHIIEARKDFKGSSGIYEVLRAEAVQKDPRRGGQM